MEAFTAQLIRTVFEAAQMDYGKTMVGNFSSESAPEDLLFCSDMLAVYNLAPRYGPFLGCPCVLSLLLRGLPGLCHCIYRDRCRCQFEEVSFLQKWNAGIPEIPDWLHRPSSNLYLRGTQSSCL
jgi:hypothetical protein